MNSDRTNAAGKNERSILDAWLERALRMASTVTSPIALTLACLSALLVAVAEPARAQTNSVLYSFGGGADGATPIAGLIQDAQGNFYGTTEYGGTNGSGTVFMVTPKGVEKVLYRFRGGPDGRIPVLGLVRDAQGNLYGTTLLGGTYDLGTVFRVSPTGAEKVLYSFTGGLDGRFPYGPLILDAQNNLYGTTSMGGTYDAGTVFRVTLMGEEKVLYTFTFGADGGYPTAGLIQDSRGIFYGTTNQGGTYGAGTVFRLTASGTERVLYSFNGAPDAAYPFAGLMLDAQGNLYGTTTNGGAYDWGTVFVVSPTGAERVLYSFAGGQDGTNPNGGLLRDGLGNLYGTTVGGGTYYRGTLFRVTPSGTKIVLHSFSGGADGYSPYSVLFLDAIGNLYGTTSGGGTYGFGTVFRLGP